MLKRDRAHLISHSIKVYKRTCSNRWYILRKFVEKHTSDEITAAHRLVAHPVGYSGSYASSLILAHRCRWREKYAFARCELISTFSTEEIISTTSELAYEPLYW